MAENASTVAYKKKIGFEKYLSSGNPTWLCNDDIDGSIDNWIPPNQEELYRWEDAKAIVDQKSKKREYFITYGETGYTSGTTYRMEILVLHMDYLGFIYVVEGGTPEQLRKCFWPTAVKLIVHFFSPRIGNPINLM